VFAAVVAADGQTADGRLSLQNGAGQLSIIGGIFFRFFDGNTRVLTLASGSPLMDQSCNQVPEQVAMSPVRSLMFMAASGALCLVNSGRGKQLLVDQLADVGREGQ
jgi:hypothetical protein